MKQILSIVMAAVLVIVSCAKADTVISEQSTAVRVEKLYSDYIMAQEAILKKRPDRRADIGGKIAAAKYCRSTLRKEFGLPNK